MPSSLPIISSNGVTEPSSTSLMRVIFSSITLLRSGEAVEMTIMNISIISTIGVMKAADRIGRLGRRDACRRRRASAARARSAAVAAPAPAIVCGVDVRCWQPLRRMTSRPTTCSSQRGSGWKVGLSV